MSRQLKLLYALILVFTLGYDSDVSGAQKKKAEEMPQGTPVLWQEPADIESRDLLAGPGGDGMKPDLSDVTFLKDESQTGYSVKFRVRDGAGKEWVAKLGNEAQPETAAVRLVWAAGYMSEVNYLAPKATIEGKGTFENVRFEARPEGVERLDEWRWDANPFRGTRELQCLKVLMALLENWDLKDSNNKVLYVEGERELHHVVSDLGATFGKTGGQNSPMALLRQDKGSRNEPADYVADKFIDGVEAGGVRFNYSGKNSAMMRDVSVENAKWVGSLLARLSDKQIEDAFRAANYSPEEVSILARAVRSRINELVNLP